MKKLQRKPQFWKEKKYSHLCPNVFYTTDLSNEKGRDEQNE
jgi:hypothetical protein